MTSGRVPGRYSHPATVYAASTGLSISFQIVGRPPACSDPDNDGDCDRPDHI